MGASGTSLDLSFLARLEDCSSSPQGQRPQARARAPKMFYYNCGGVYKSEEAAPETSCKG